MRHDTHAPNYFTPIDEKTRELELGGLDAPEDVGGLDLPAVAMIGINSRRPVMKHCRICWRMRLSMFQGVATYHGVAHLLRRCVADERVGHGRVAGDRWEIDE